MISDEAEEVIIELFDSLKNRYQNDLESMKDIEFVFDYVELFYYKCDEKFQSWWIIYRFSSLDKKRKATISPVTVTLNYDEIKKDPQWITKYKPFINKYNWQGRSYPSKEDDCKKIEKKNLTIVLNVLYTKKEKPYPAYVSKHNSNREAWHYLAVKILSAVLRAIMSKHHGSFYCLKCLYSSATESKRESQKKVCENKDCCDVVILSEDTKILEFNQYQKSDKGPFVIYADLEGFMEKIDGCKINPENSYTTKAGEHIPSVFSMSTKSAFKSIENKHDVNTGKDCMKKFCESIREHAIKIINF